MIPSNAWEVLVPLAILAVVAHLAAFAGSGQSLFGAIVRADRANSQSAAALRRTYLRKLWLHTLLAAAVPVVLQQWNVGIGLLAVAWQGFQAGMAWWNAHTESLGYEKHTAENPLSREESEPAGLARSWFAQAGPYILIAGFFGYVLSSTYSQGREWGAFLLPYLVGLIVCAFVGFADRVSKTPRFALALGIQYFLAVVTMFWASMNTTSANFPNLSSLFHLVFLAAVNHLAFFAMKNGLVGFDPEWESRPGFDGPPVEGLSIQDVSPSEKRANLGPNLTGHG